MSRQSPRSRCTGLQSWRRSCAALLLLLSALPGPARAESAAGREARSGRKASSSRKASSAASGNASRGKASGGSASERGTAGTRSSPPAEEPSTVMDEKAAATFEEGLAAFDRRDFEAARVAFLQTFALKPSVPVVRRNLGLAEIYSGHYLEGARRLARVLHTTDEGTAEDRARMLESLKKAEAHLERVSIEVRQDGAEIIIDGADLGASPLPFLWYVAPGQYEVRVLKAGFVEHKELRVARAGMARHLVIALAAERAEPPSRPAVPPVEMVEPAGPNGWLLLGGGVLTAGALAAGAAFTIAAESNADKVDRLGNELANRSCAPPNLPQCGPLHDATETHDNQQRYALASFCLAGASGVATLLYGLLGGSDADEPAEDPIARGQSTLAGGWDRAGPYLLWSGEF